MYVYLVVFAGLWYLVWLKLIYDRHRHTFRKSLEQAMNVSSGRENDGADVRALIVTAHPDDECMFFAPTIIRLAELNARVHLLCLSEGNYYNQGAQRREELLSSCAVLGIPASRVTIIDHKKLPDDPKAEWSVSLVSSTVLNHIKAHSINTDRLPCCVNTSALQPQFAVVRAKRVDKDIWVLTFDGSGVSGHANHVAIYKAVRHLASTGDLPKDCVLLSLETVGLLRKYLSFLDLPFSWLLPSHFCCAVGSKGYKQAKAAMLCHRTQLLWFRYLYITFSRYMFINTFQMIPQGPKNLKIY